MASFFNANADPGAPDSYPTLQLRQRIAEAMLKNATRRGYPKNIGEGLTAIGDAIGERGQMQALMGSQKSIEDLAVRNSPAEIRAREGTPVSEAQPTSQTADAQPDVHPPIMAQDDTSDASPQPWFDTASANNAAYQPGPGFALPLQPDASSALAAGPLNDAQASQMASLVGPPGQPKPAPYFPTASLGNGPVVPQPNPTLGAGDIPSAATIPTLAAVGAGGAGSPPEAATNRQIDFPMPNTQLAETRGPGAVVPIQMPNPRPRTPPADLPPDTPTTPQTAAPLPDQPTGVYAKPIPPQKPGPEPIGDEQRKWQDLAIRNKALHGDPDTTAAYEAEAARLEGIRKEREAQRMKQYDNQLALHNQLMDKWTADVRALPQTQEKLKQERYTTQKQMEEDQLKSAFGNLPPHVHTYLAGSQKNAQSAVESLQGIQNARQVIDAGTLFGVEAPAKLLYYKAKAAIGDANAARIVAATETYRTALGPTAAQAIRTYGGPQVSNEDRKEGFAMTGADFSLNEQTARRMLDIGERSALAALKEHRDNMDTMIKGQQGEGRLRRMYDVPDPLPGISLGGGPRTEYQSMEEAQQANLPKGSKFMINGKKYKVE